MKIIAKILAALLLITVIGVVSGYTYYVRGQKIEIDFMPREFNYCGRVIADIDPEFKEIVNWLRENSEGWSRDWNTQIAGLVYGYPAFSVVVFEGGVSVSYKTDSGYPRFIKSIKHSLKTSCEGSS
ncbi:hypothetical protein [Teredinibacter purpureus]|uniref:hypothetical protein n=1 Tax=Teredinibacter purpureus TaxID=2731756 RepID=UPI0005F85CEC|nr:hypothetical protein [Teredinibacter purpureus]